MNRRLFLRGALARVPRSRHRRDRLRPHRPLRPDPARRHRLRRHRLPRRRRRRRHLGRPHRRRRRPRPRQGRYRSRRHRPRGGARLHQHAELGGLDLDPGRPLAERHPPGGDARGVRRRHVDGPLERRDEEDQPRAAGLDPLRHPVDHAGRVPRVHGAQGHLAQRRVLRRRHHRARARDRLRRPAADAGGARAHAGAGAPGDGGRRARRRLVADLRAGVLRLDRGADRALQGGGGVRRDVHLAHAERGRPAARRHRRADPHLARSEAAGRDLPPQGVGQGELGQARRGDRQGRAGARRGAAHHRRHVHLHRRLDRPRRHHAAVGAGRRARRLDRAHEGPRHPQEARAGDEHADRRLGEHVPLGQPRGHPAGRLPRARAALATSARRSARSRPSAARKRGRPRSTW